MISTSLQIQKYNLNYTKPNFSIIIFIQTLFYIFASMTAKEFLKTGRVGLKHIAKAMWPDKTTGSDVMLSMKLNGHRPWTDEDERLAKIALLKLKIDIDKIVK